MPLRPADVDRLSGTAAAAELELPLRLSGLLDSPPLGLVVDAPCLLLPGLPPVLPPPSRLGLFPSKSPRANRRDDDDERASRDRRGGAVSLLPLPVPPPPPWLGGRVVAPPPAGP